MTAHPDARLVRARALEAVMPGPVPKRTDQRRRANATEIEVSVAPATGVTFPKADPSLHPIAREWFDALGQSGQAAFFEPSDVAQAKLLAYVMSDMLNSDRMSAQMFASVLTGASELLTTEGSRRRLRIELAKANEGPSEADLAATADMASYRKRLGS